MGRIINRRNAVLGWAVWKITKADKRFSDWSYDLLLLALSLALLAFCPGRYAFP